MDAMQALYYYVGSTRDRTLVKVVVRSVQLVDSRPQPKRKKAVLVTTQGYSRMWGQQEKRALYF